MIFVTVGHQMPFERLVRLVDGWAGARRRRDVFAQIGRSSYRPRNFAYREFLSAAEFDQRVREASAVVGHAGSGSIIQGLYRRRPMLVLPRLSELQETRNDHQVGTAEFFARTGQLLMAKNDEDLVRLMDEVEAFTPKCLVGDAASERLLGEIQRFLASHG
jgi:UDP-N-acetylglucosamine transferase subunit ALG13